MAFFRRIHSPVRRSGNSGPETENKKQDNEERFYLVRWIKNQLSELP